MANIVKDTDTTISITLNDENGDPVDLGTLAGIICKVFQKSIPFDKFSLNAMAGYRDLVITDAPNGVFEIYLNADNTHSGIVGRPIFYEVKTQIVNTNYDNSTEEKSSGVIELATLVRSDSKEVSFV